MFCQASNDHSSGDLETIKKIENYLFQTNDKLGKGNFSTVYSGKDQNTGQPVAVKVVKLQQINSVINKLL
jgi:serine/threonine-protein kinase ULK/ATG1